MNENFQPRLMAILPHNPICIYPYEHITWKIYNIWGSKNMASFIYSSSSIGVSEFWEHYDQ